MNLPEDQPQDLAPTSNPSNDQPTTISKDELEQHLAHINEQKTLHANNFQQLTGAENIIRHLLAKLSKQPSDQA